MHSPRRFSAVPSLAYFRFGVIALVLLISGITLFSVPAWADDFLFSFTNTSGTVSGTVSGEIFGLTNNSTSAATEVIITSAPSSLGLGEATPIIATLWNDPIHNSFTELSGNLTAVNFSAKDLAVTGDFLTLSAGSSLTGSTGSLISSSTIFSQFTPDPPPAAPEIDPQNATSALALLVGAVLVIRGRRRKIIQPEHACEWA